MDPRRIRRSPALFFALLPGLVALLPALLGALPGSGPEVTAAAEHSDPPVARDPNSMALTDSGFASLPDRIAQREYRASANGSGLQAPNRAHNLRTYFSPTGIRVHDRVHAGSPELLSLNLAGIGRGETPAPVQPGEVTSDGARVEIKRPGTIEWYQNSPAGLEHGVTLTKRPAGEGPLVVEHLVRGARASLSGEEVRFTTPTGRQLSYAKLAAFDARGHVLDAHIALPEPSRLQWVVNDANAVYPIVIDPLLTAVADTQLESNQVSASLGTSVSGAGDINGDGFDDVIVGASSYDAGQSNEGAAFIFLGSATGIADGDPDTADTQIESNQANAFMGSSVAGIGDVNDDGYDDVIIGAYLYDAGEEDEGAAFVFLGSAAGIADGDPSTADAQIESDQVNANMGASVAGAGDVDDDGYADVIVGAYRYDTGLANLQCTKCSGICPPTFTQQGFHPFECCEGPGIGECLNEGAAFVFLGSASGIASGGPADADTMLASDNETSWLGWSVAGAGDVNGDGYDDVIAGAMAWDVIRPPQIPHADRGSVFIFLGGPAGVADGTPDTAATHLQGTKSRSLFGNSVAGAGDINGDGFDDMIVGAIQHEIGPANLDEGVVFLYLSSAAGIPDGSQNTADSRIEANQIGAHLGSSVAGAGDLNDDGYDDVIIGANRYDAGEQDEGAAFVYFGSAAGIPIGDPSTAAIQFESDQAGAWMGWSAAGAGDVNGDGVVDVIVGAPLFNAPSNAEGAAFVYLAESPPVLLVPEPAFILGLAAGVACLAILARQRHRTRAI